MSLLKTKVEDLLNTRMQDARKIAQSTIKHDVDDLVSNKNREDTDSHAQDAIDQAVKTGKVHQEASSEEILNKYKQFKKMKTSDLKTKWKQSRGVGDASGLDKEGLISDLLRDEFGKKQVNKAFNIDEKEMKGKDPCWKGYEMIGMKDKDGKKVPNCVPKESEEFSESYNKVFFNKAEQDAFIQFMAQKEIKDPISGMVLISDSYLLDMTSQLGSFIELKNRLSQMVTEYGLLENKDYLKNMTSLLKKIDNLEESSPDILVWKTLTAYLQPVV